MTKKFLIIIIQLFISFSAIASQDAKHPKQLKWTFDGVFGKFDRQAAQRGYKVYKEVCATCHSLHLVAFRNLESIGFSSAEVKALAAETQVIDGPNDEGEMFERPGIPSDKLPSPYKNDKAARASNNGALPPDLSLIIKARQDGANYLYSLITGFNEPKPNNVELQPGMYYNPYFPNGQIAMAPPILSDGQVTYDDDTKPTIDQMTRDVVTFLQWAAEPEMEHRKSMGIKVLLYLSIMTLFFILAKEIVWRRVR